MFINKYEEVTKFVYDRLYIKKRKKIRVCVYVKNERLTYILFSSWKNIKIYEKAYRTHLYLPNKIKFV